MPSDNIRAALFMIAGSCAASVNDTFMKLLSTEMGMFQILSLRGAVVSIAFGVILWRLRIPILALMQRDRWLLLLRSVAETCAAFFYFRALFDMPLADVTAIIQVVPLSVALAAWLFLSEPLGWRRLSAILLGFAGVILIIRPGSEAFTTASVDALLSVVMVTIRDLATRMMTRQVPSMLVAFTTSLGVTVLGVVGSSAESWVTPSAVALFWLAGSILFVGLGYYLVILAMRVGEMSFAAPFRYASLIAALLLGWFVLGEWPDAFTMIGSAIVVGTGVFALYRERQLRSGHHRTQSR